MTVSLEKTALRARYPHAWHNPNPQGTTPWVFPNLNLGPFEWVVSITPDGWFTVSLELRGRIERDADKRFPAHSSQIKGYVKYLADRLYPVPSDSRPMESRAKRLQWALYRQL